MVCGLKVPLVHSQTYEFTKNIYLYITCIYIYVMFIFYEI